MPCGAPVKQIRLAEGALDLCLTLYDRECEWDSAAEATLIYEQ